MSSTLLCVYLTEMASVEKSRSVLNNPLLTLIPITIKGAADSNMRSSCIVDSAISDVARNITGDNLMISNSYGVKFEVNQSNRSA